ncbi:MAG: hypothetical protein HC882_06005 [Acidobacteria bacterium]|nr:hypothetical protein [Acidobacteriota bacterium]
MRMKHARFAVVLALATGSIWAEEASEKVPPAFRNERHFEAGVSFLRALPDGSDIEVRRADGSRFVLALRSGALSTTLPESRIENDGRTLVLPLGYRVYFKPEKPASVVVEAPAGALTSFSWINRSGVAIESDGGYWKSNYDPFILRIADGTRIDAIDAMKRWEAVTLRGERFRLSLPEGTWTALPAIPSPPLIPAMNSFYVAGDGNDWRKPAGEDHAVFSWNWIQIGLPLERLISDVSAEPRRTDLRLYFDRLEMVQNPADMAARSLRGGSVSPAATWSRSALRVRSR